MPKGSLFNSAVDFPSGSWVEPRIQFDTAVPHGSAGEYCGNINGWLLSPGPLDSLILATQVFMTAGLSAMLVGPSGCGKSSIISLLRNSDHNRCAVANKSTGPH